MVIVASPEARGKQRRCAISLKRYTSDMARGWESKSVEDQISSAEAEKKARSKAPSSQRRREIQAQRESLLLLKTNLLNRFKAARHERYRAQLQLALEEVEAKLREIEGDRRGFSD